MVRRAFSVLTLKAFDEESRTFEGVATTPEPDRLGDIVEPKGAQFTLPIPLLWQHRSDQPIGHVTHATVKADGITIRAKVLKIDEPGKLKDRLDEAWQSLKSQLVRGLSIGFNPLESVRIENTFSYRFPLWEWLELSAVTIPANADATITAIKSAAAQELDASVTASESTARRSPGVPGPVVVTARKGASVMKKTIAEQIRDFEATRQAKAARMTEIMDTAAATGVTLDEAQSQEYEGLASEVKSIDTHLVRLDEQEKLNKAAARPVAGANPTEGAASRGPSVISLARNLPPGIEFAQAILCKVASFVHIMRGEGISAADIAKQRYPDNSRIQTYLKGAVPAGNTTDTVWASPLVDPTNLATEFIEFLRPMTIIGKFGLGGIPSLRRIPFNVRIIGQTSGGNGYWVGQGAPKPLTSFAFEPTTLTWAKVAAIAVITEELARFSSPSAEALVRDSLAAAIVERIDTDFVDPAQAAVANVSPASITNGITPLSSAGTSADNIRTDLQNLLEQFILQNLSPESLVLIMPNTLALAASLMRNSLGQKEFPALTMRGGDLDGIPVITSQYAANQSGSGNLVIAVNASDIFLSDDGQVTVDASREASLQMLDNPTNNSNGTPTTMVSMFQTNSIALRAERFINWKRRRTAAVAFMADVNWGAVGSPS